MNLRIHGFIRKYGPQIGAVYRIAAKRNFEYYLDHGFGPFWDNDLEELILDEPVTPLLPIPPLRQLLEEDGVDNPEFRIGDRASYHAEWATEECAIRNGIPVRGKIYNVVGIKNDGLDIQLEGVKLWMPAWHLRKGNGAE